MVREDNLGEMWISAHANIYRLVNESFIKIPTLVDENRIEEAYADTECEYILVLDDDNLIVEDSMKKLESLSKYLENLENNFILSFNRDMREDNVRIVKEGWIKGYVDNNFNGFNFLHLTHGIYTSRTPLASFFIADSNHHSPFSFSSTKGTLFFFLEIYPFH